MDARLQQLMALSAQAGQQQYTAWDAALFQQWCAGPVQQVWDALATSPDAVSALRNYLRLVQEGIGRGYLTAIKQGSSNLVAALLSDRLPQWLPVTPADRRAELMATVWNLAEGIGREAAWLDQYALARLAALNDPENLATQLVELLRPVLEPLPIANWTGPFRVSLLDTRVADEDFLPGVMRWIAPRVLCVSDRRRAANLGVLLDQTNGVSLIGSLQQVQPYVDGRPLPRTQWELGAVCIQGQRLELPHWPEPHTHAMSSGGWLVASSVNSQRLWIVESQEQPI